ncbi:MAG: 4Fe-4S dicluster domain-containing protein [Acidobacteria bacterium]|nr:4Fe-4S dicluster domain-containing protein [Acidobacteriota bacterium]
MPDLSQATRPIMWNISPAWLMYVLLALALAVFGYGLARRISFWRRGRADGERFGAWGKRLRALLGELLLQRRVRGSRLPGLFHSLIFYSFAMLVVVTTVVALDYDFGTSLFRGWLYVFLTVAAELAGVLVLAGVGIAAWRRYVRKPATLETTFADTFALLLIGALVLTGFLAEGLRMATLGDPWPWLSPVGYGASFLFAGVSEPAGRAVHATLWWTHTVLALGWIATIPYTKFFHMLALPTDVFFAKLKPRGELSRVDIEKLMTADDFDESTFRVGVEQVGDLTWKHRLDTDACICCGRCDEICPAVLAGHPFSPRRLIQAHKKLLAAGGKDAAIVGNVFDEEFIWHCRTCTACMEVCPAAIEHVDTVLELRRNEVMMQGRVPPEAARCLKMLESNGNPFGLQEDRVSWIETMGCRVVAPGEDCDVIYWIGCCTTYDPAKQSIAADICRLLDRCGIEWGVLGADEKCCGDPARVMGEERLFQEIAKAQVEAIKQRKFRVLLTSCPHCANVLRNEYKQFGGDFTVAHHSEFLHEMLWSGDLQPRLGEPRRVVYHDPCYLGRYQHVYDSPRQVLRALPGATLVEMKSHEARSLCCGGGGGHYWMDLKAGERINNLRVKQAQDVGADTIVTGCAYCKQMLEDSVKLADLDDKMQVIDLASLVVRSLPARPLATDAPAAGAAGKPVSAAGGAAEPAEAAPPTAKGA